MSLFTKYFTERLYRYVVEKRLTTGIWKDIVRYWKKGTKGINTLIAHGAWKRISKKTSIVNNQIMFRTYQDKYTCNPKYLCEQLIKSGLDCKLVWVYSKKSGDLDQFPPQAELIKFGTWEYYKALAQSKYWIENAHNFTWEGFPKKSEQVLINLWHGSLGLKRIDPENDSNRHRRLAGKLSGKTTNYCISNSEFEEMVFRTSYWPNTEFKRFGHARNDILFSDKEKMAAIKKKVCNTLGIDPKYKLLLYAPTFRDNNDDFSCFDIDYDKLKAALEKRFGGEWLILSRFHMHTQNVIKKNFRILGLNQSDYIVSADNYDDIQELMVAADAGITDYSSWICDFVLTRRPAFLFAVDEKSYVSERGFYYSLDTTPFPIARNNKQLIDCVINFDEESYKQKTEQYLDALGCCEDGHAAERIVELIKDEMNKNNVKDNDKNKDKDKSTADTVNKTKVKSNVNNSNTNIKGNNNNVEKKTKSNAAVKQSDNTAKKNSGAGNSKNKNSKNRSKRKK